MSALRRVAALPLAIWHRARFAAWVLRARARLRLRGAELVVEAPHGARLKGFPRIEFDPWGAVGEARTVLTFGRGVAVGRGVVLELNPRGTNLLRLEDRSVVGDTVRLQLRNGSIRLGPRTRLRAFVVLKSEGEIDLAGDVEVSYGATVHCAERVEVGAGTGIAERVSIIDSDHIADGTDRHFLSAPIRLGPVVIGSNVFLAAGAVVTRGIRVGRNSVVAAGAVLTGEREFPESALIAGAPGRVVRSLRAGDQEAPTSER